jgi:hypothetical protein
VAVKAVVVRKTGKVLKPSRVQIPTPPPFFAQSFKQLTLPSGFFQPTFNQSRNKPLLKQPDTFRVYLNAELRFSQMPRQTLPAIVEGFSRSRKPHR